MNTGVKFVLQYVAGFVVFAGSFILLNAYAFHWPVWSVIVGVLAIAAMAALKFLWDLSGFNGGHSS